MLLSSVVQIIERELVKTKVDGFVSISTKTVDNVLKVTMTETKGHENPKFIRELILSAAYRLN